MSVGVVIVAAGLGTRAGGGVQKQWRPLAGATSVHHALQAFAAHPAIETAVLVLHPDMTDSPQAAGMPSALIVSGGTTRSQSVLAGLEALEGRCDRVLIHDGARPCVSRAVIDGVLAALEHDVAAAPALPVVDALWTGGKGGDVTGLADRTGLYRAQTPQGFRLDLILAAHRAHPEGADDDVALMLRAGHRVQITAGDEDNLKITHPADFARAGRILEARDGHQAG
ncbi:2-C-methyl-D-erythritol 4-phosphate cytidylyltransferase [Roseobacter ponti]|uniref:2-C-methyl-D-erythritol 4-phosphate cytidylyltransferase n=1 Tax=Roseobacter ponti TaxID=1891787 RepID=A0A858STN1_9RHOB|nr:2-C-methyl-D-erythritol 4-phosphate cytidylyltransferase [Roseobacter ponti]QJF51318.1 2-C-methyl-D-erythritol 4-phosphate cytidylyltransferase [Roseobacter ponti]